MRADNAGDQWEERIACVFHLHDHRAIPDVDSDTLGMYRAFLMAHCVFPVHGSFEHEDGPLSSRTVHVIYTRIADEIDEMYGVFIEGVVGARHILLPLAEFLCDPSDVRNARLIEDYQGWFWDYR